MTPPAGRSSSRTPRSSTTALPCPRCTGSCGRAERDLVSRLESTGGVRAAEAAADPAELEAAHRRYEAAS